MKYAIDEKMIGEIQESRMKKLDIVRLFTWKRQPA